MSLDKNNINRLALKLHKKLGGKLEVKSKAPLKTRSDLSLAYTPGVAAVCGVIFKNPRLAKTYTIKKNTVAVVTDGSAVLGLGNLGPLGALPVMEGKCALLKEFGGVDAFPICLDTQDPEEIIGTVKIIAPVFGGILLEDISAPRCFEIEERLQQELNIPVVHDDQHGTATVVLAGLINALKLKKIPPAKAKVVINGAGAAGTATAKLLSGFGVKHLVVCDRKGIIFHGRKDLNKHKLALSRISGRTTGGDLPLAIKGTDVFIGLSSKGVLKPGMIKLMDPQPVIFALANPEPEMHPLAAKAAGAFIVATGRSDYPNQLNNLLVFPGLFRGLLDSGKTNISPEVLIKAARSLADFVKTPKPDLILPSPLNKQVVKVIAKNL